MTVDGRERWFAAIRMGADGSRREGRLAATPHAFVFDDGAGRVTLPFTGLHAEMGGAGRKLLFLKPTGADWCLYTRETALLREPDVLAHPAFAALAPAFRWGQGRVWAAAVVLAALATALLGGLYVGRQPAARWLARHIPPAWEESLGELAFKQMTVQKRFLTDPGIAADLQALTAPLVAAIPHKRFTYRFHVVDDATANAFALPGGHVVIHGKLIQAAASAEEVLGVVAHEIAHVERQHGVRQILSSTGLYLILQTLVGDVTGLVAVVADGGGYLLTQSFSRAFEAEADEAGYDYLAAAGIDPHGLLAFFTRMRAEEERIRAKVAEATGATPPSALWDLMSSHPATAEREAALKARLAGDARAYPKFPLDFAAFQRKIVAASAQP